MAIIQKHLKLKRDEYYKRHLLIINNLLPVQMTSKEAEVLAAFMSLEGELANYRFSSLGRKLVREKLGISFGGLGNYLDQLRYKGFLITKGKDFDILPILIPDENKQLYQFKIEIE